MQARELPDWINRPLTVADHAALPDHVRQRVRLVNGYARILPPPDDAAPAPATGAVPIPAWMLAPLTAKDYDALPAHVRRRIEVVDGWIQIRPIPDEAHHVAVTKLGQALRRAAPHDHG
jgi:hypothetical protein